jgi:hypothetical protein
VCGGKDRVRDARPTKGGVVVRIDVEGAGCVGECATMHVGVVKRDGGSAVGGNEDAIHVVRET